MGNGRQLTDLAWWYREGEETLPDVGDGAELGVDHAQDVRLRYGQEPAGERRACRRPANCLVYRVERHGTIDGAVSL